MGEVIMMPDRGRRPNERQPSGRTVEAKILADVIAKKQAKFSAGECQRVADHVYRLFDTYADKRGRGAMADLCAQVWPNPNDPNPSRRRADIKTTKKAAKLAEYVRRFAAATGENEDDLLLAVFRDTAFDRAVTRRLEGKGDEPDLEAFWGLLSDTLHTLAEEISRVEGMAAHLERLVALSGGYDLATDTIYPTLGRMITGPLVNWEEHVEHFPPIPSIVLFTEPKSKTVDRLLTIRDTGQVIAVTMTVLREVRLAIGPGDILLFPEPLFEFRSVLQLIGPDGPLRIRTPWLYLDENEVDVLIDGVWRKADIPFDGGDPASMPEGYEGQAEFEVDGLRHRGWQFPAALEAPLQHEHNYVVWRAVTAGTCRDHLLRPLEDVSLGPFAAASEAEWTETFCPAGTIANAIENALHSTAPDGLPQLLRAEARRLVTRVRAFHEERAGAAIAAHETLRTRWQGWSAED
jgi:hypothetical protein